MLGFLKHWSAAPKEKHLIEFMPDVRGTLKKDYPLAKLTRFGVGGPAEVFFEPADINDLSMFLARTNGVTATVIGSGSNLLVRDGGIPGIVIKLGEAFTGVKIEGTHIILGAAVMNNIAAKAAMEAGLSGLEFLAGIPGNIGGSLRMNAGAAGADMSMVMVSAKLIDEFGHIKTIMREEMIFSYRETVVPRGWVFVEVILQGTPKDKAEIAAKMNELKIRRLESQPVGVKTAGSTFKNPMGLFAWKLIDKAGCRGLKVGGAIVSDKHCNFIINTGKATANDIETLGEEIRKRVFKQSAIDLKWEVRRVGVKKINSNAFGGIDAKKEKREPEAFS